LKGSLLPSCVGLWVAIIVENNNIGRVRRDLGKSFEGTRNLNVLPVHAFVRTVGSTVRIVRHRILGLRHLDHVFDVSGVWRVVEHVSLRVQRVTKGSRFFRTSPERIKH